MQRWSRDLATHSFSMPKLNNLQFLILHIISILQEYKVKLAKVTTVRQELKSHIDNLPDITLLPKVSGGLAPLPSAGDLFH